VLRHFARVPGSAAIEEFNVGEIVGAAYYGCLNAAAVEIEHIGFIAAEEALFFFLLQLGGFYDHRYEDGGGENDKESECFHALRFWVVAEYVLAFVFFLLVGKVADSCHCCGKKEYYKLMIAPGNGGDERHRGYDAKKDSPGFHVMVYWWIG
jgi:hypothetical protein